MAEGLVYPMFTKERIAPDESREYRKYMISMDYGTRNPTAMMLWGLCGGVWYGFREYYYDSRAEMAQKTDQEYYDDLCRFAGDLPIDHIIIDPSALSFITLVEKNHRFRVWDADNDVLDGIRHTAQCISDGTIRICKSCENTIREFGLYSWDEDAVEDRPSKRMTTPWTPFVTSSRPRHLEQKERQDAVLAEGRKYHQNLSGSGGGRL